jgi:hypothetical protein
MRAAAVALNRGDGGVNSDLPPDIDSRHASIGLTGSEFNEKKMTGCPFTQTGSPFATLRQPSACTIVRRYQRRELRLE